MRVKRRELGSGKGLHRRVHVGEKADYGVAQHEWGSQPEHLPCYAVAYGLDLNIIFSLHETGTALPCRPPAFQPPCCAVVPPPAGTCPYAWDHRLDVLPQTQHALPQLQRKVVYNTVPTTVSPGHRLDVHAGGGGARGVAVRRGGARGRGPAAAAAAAPAREGLPAHRLRAARRAGRCVERETVSAGSPGARNAVIMYVLLPRQSGST